MEVRRYPRAKAKFRKDSELYNAGPARRYQMALASLMNYLDENNVRYIVLYHSPAYTAQGIAGLAHIPGQELAKTVIVLLDGKLVMAVLPASYHVDLMLLRKHAKAKTAELASEEDFQGRFTGCETGAMPPFGNLFGIPVYADQTLEKDREIAFNAGTHRELVRMKWEDYKKLVQPTVMRFATGHSVAAA
jgi:Ala-tRNA(Pro) deacylase